MKYTKLLINLKIVLQVEMTYMIKHSKASMIIPLISICDRSFVNGIFPREFGIEYVIPIYK